jgi:hypothetical protein
MSARRWPCPCCGCLTFETKFRDSYAICPVCFWEDDEIQTADPTYAGGANRASLDEARRNYAKFGVSELRFSEHVRPPRPDERPVSR